METSIQLFSIDRWYQYQQLATFTKLWDEIEYLIATINQSRKAEYEKDFMKIKFNSDDK